MAEDVTLKIDLESDEPPVPIHRYEDSDRSGPGASPHRPRQVTPPPIITPERVSPEKDAPGGGAPFVPTPLSIQGGFGSLFPASSIGPLFAVTAAITALNQGAQLVTRTFDNLVRTTQGLIQKFEDVGSQIRPYGTETNRAFVQREIDQIRQFQRIASQYDRQYATMIRVQTEISENLLTLRVHIMEMMYPIIYAMAQSVKLIISAVEIATFLGRKIVERINRFFGDPGPEATAEQEFKEFFNYQGMPTPTKERVEGGDRLLKAREEFAEDMKVW